MPNHHRFERNGVEVHLFKFDNDIRGLNIIAHVDLKQNLCHDMAFREQITNMLWYHGSSIDSYLKLLLFLDFTAKYAFRCGIGGHCGGGTKMSRPGTVIPQKCW